MAKPYSANTQLKILASVTKFLKHNFEEMCQSSPQVKRHALRQVIFSLRDLQLSLLNRTLPPLRTGQTSRMTIQQIRRVLLFEAKDYANSEKFRDAALEAFRELEPVEYYMYIHASELDTEAYKVIELLKKSKITITQELLDKVKKVHALLETKTQQPAVDEENDLF